MTPAYLHRNQPTPSLFSFSVSVEIENDWELGTCFKRQYAL